MTLVLLLKMHLRLSMIRKMLHLAICMNLDYLKIRREHKPELIMPS